MVEHNIGLIQIISKMGAAELINNIILYGMMILMCIGGLDRCFGNRLKLGEKFEEGFMAAGPLALAIVGIVCIAPALGPVLTPIITPVYNLLGASPVMFAGTLFGSDTGAYHLAISMAGDDIAIRNFSGLILGSMLGTVIVFTTPLALSIIRVEDRVYYAKGVLIGLTTIPFGCIAGGLIAGYPMIWMLKNLLPVIIFSGIIAAGFILVQNFMIKGFLVFGKIIVIFLTLSLMIAGFQGATGKILIPNMTPIDESFAIVGQIAVALAGAFVLVHLVTKFLSKPLSKIGALLGMNEVAAAGMIASLANSIAMFVIMKDMDERGKVINVAFTVSAAFILGDHLGFTAAVAPDMLTAVLFGKFIAGVLAVVVAVLVLPKNKEEVVN